MSCSTLRSRSQWHDCPGTRALLADLEPNDVRLTLVRSVPGPDHLEWYPDSDHGAATFEALATLRRSAVGPAFAMALNDGERAAALASAQQAPTVAAIVATRFGDPDRWLGYGPIEATRRFRANWT